MTAIYRSDGELCGFIRPHADGWEALTVFGVVIERPSTQSEAEALVRDKALAALAER